MDTTAYEYFEFVYPNGTIYKITDPISLSSEEGKSIVTDSDGLTHIITPGFIVMRTKERIFDKSQIVTEDKEKSNTEEDN